MAKKENVNLIETFSEFTVIVFFSKQTFRTSIKLCRSLDTRSPLRGADKHTPKT